jgi:hypothetical protein
MKRKIDVIRRRKNAKVLAKHDPEPWKWIIDLCCGGRHFWIDKECRESVFMDIRSVDQGAISIQPNWSVKPDLIGDYTDIPFNDDSFRLVIWDIPHKIKSDSGIINLKYGSLGENWKSDLERGFTEINRILEDRGILIFKFNDLDIPFKEILSAFPMDKLGLKPIGFTPTKKGVNNTAFFVFVKRGLN